MNETQSFGKWLRSRRRELDLTQEELARRSGCAQVTIRKFESDEMRPSKQLAELLMEQLGVPLDERENFVHFARGGGTTPIPNALPQHNFTDAVSSFIGRAREMTEVEQLLDTSRLVTLTGSGGSGKTRLAIEVARQELNRFSDGAWLIDFVPLHESTLVHQIVASALGVREEANRPLIQTMTEYLRSKNLLLIFDNCEHLIDPCAKIANMLLQACPKLQILATSREPLGIMGENQYYVPALTLPDEKSEFSIEEMNQSEAVCVFVDRVAMVRPNFALTTANAHTVAQICRRLDGSPLAIDLAAARVKGLNVEQVAARLDDRFRLLNAGNRVAFPRQHTLRATIDWSYNLLSEAECILLSRLSVFAGSWSLDAASFVCSTGAVGQSDVPALLSNLADKSLVIVEEYDSEIRYRFLETIREYAREKLSESGEERQIQDRHLGFYINLSENAEQNYRNKEQLLWFVVMEKERDNLREALDFVLHTDQSETSLRLIGTAFWLWFFRGSWSEGQGRVEDALSQSPEGNSTSRAKALMGLGLLNFVQSGYLEARINLEKSITIWRELDDKWWSAFVLGFLGLIVRGQDQLAASVLFQKSLDLAKEINEKWILAFSLWNIGENNLYQKNLSEAALLLEKSLQLAQALGDKLLQNEVLRALGETAEAEQEYTRAVELYQESLAIIRELGDTTNISVLHYDLGRALQLTNSNDKAEYHFIESAKWSIRLGKKAGLLRALAGLGVVEAARGEAYRSVNLFAASEMLFTSLGVSFSFNPHHYQSEWFERNLALARKQLGEETFAAAWVEGQAMTQEQAMNYALRVN